MDLLMPEMDGLEATRRIRQMESATGAHLPIVAVTACATDNDRDACFEAGMDGYLTKPFNPQKLAEILQGFAPGR
jgi:CheY-like chemotaxis protein